MDEMKWEAYLINGYGGEIINLKELTEEQRRELDQRLNEQCADAVVIRGYCEQKPLDRDSYSKLIE